MVARRGSARGEGDMREEWCERRMGIEVDTEREIKMDGGVRINREMQRWRVGEEAGERRESAARKGRKGGVREKDARLQRRNH